MNEARSEIDSTTTERVEGTGLEIEDERREIQGVSEQVLPQIEKALTDFSAFAGRVQEHAAMDHEIGMSMLDEVQAHAIEARNELNRIIEELAHAKRSLKGTESAQEKAM
jgi:hypothetical protein